MAGTDQTFNLTKEDVRKVESRDSRAHDGNVPAGSLSSTLQSIVDSADKNKADIIAERQANLPLPDQPPQPSDWNSADARTVNVGSGAQPTANFTNGDDALRGPATGDSAARADPDATKSNVLGGNVGRQGVDGIPNDAVTREAKHKQGLADTTNADYGYPQKSDPANTSKLH